MSKVRILGATGRLFEAAAVVPTVEANISFNGTQERKFEVASSMDENPNGLLFMSDTEGMDEICIRNENIIEYIGNIPTELVREVLNWLLVKGYYNFSEWDYQKEKKLNKIVLDNGNSRPYSSAITNSLYYGLIKNPASQLSCDNWSFLTGEHSDSSKSFIGHVDDLRTDRMQEKDNACVFGGEWDDDIEEDGWEEWDSSEE